MERTTFENIQVQNMPIASAFNSHLDLATGDTFAAINAIQNDYVDRKGNHVTRTTYNVRVLNSKLLEIGTPLRISVKKASVLNEKIEKESLLNGKSILLIFKNLKRWIINGNESLAADDVQILNVDIKDVVK
ncbi:hypothetical protein [Ligilactobacillus aviarius]|uniref:hypothetical protein n=1 Tax=Ligilactobacillus aviarius TaxID=1606 RepID=UPI0024BA1F50|nr:hypothetical protein [Ligilactobacillus aviarius]